MISCNAKQQYDIFRCPFGWDGSRLRVSQLSRMDHVKIYVTQRCGQRKHRKTVPEMFHPATCAARHRSYRVQILVNQTTKGPTARMRRQPESLHTLLAYVSQHGQIAHIPHVKQGFGKHPQASPSLGVGATCLSSIVAFQAQAMGVWADARGESRRLLKQRAEVGCIRPCLRLFWRVLVTLPTTAYI
jgi:hypothetical protein